MHVIDMEGGHETVQGRVDGSRARIQIERAMRQIVDHLVLMRDAAIEAFERIELVEIERREAVELH